MIALAALRTRAISAIPDLDPYEARAAPAPDAVAAAVIEAAGLLEYGLLLVDGGSRVHFASRRAQEQLRAGPLHVHAGQLRTETTGETANLHRLIARYAGPERQDDDAAYFQVDALLLQFAPLAAPPPGGAPADGALVAVFVVDLDGAADPGAAQLRLQFGLTAAEAAFAREIVKGVGLKTCAVRVGISEATARTHLHHILAKTGTRRQAELVRLLLASRPIIRRP